jgi:hypothetical protein
MAALSADLAGATIAVIAGRVGISTTTARQALIAYEKNGTATRVKGGRGTGSSPGQVNAASSSEPSGKRPLASRVASRRGRIRLRAGIMKWKVRAISWAGRSA